MRRVQAAQNTKWNKNWKSSLTIWWSKWTKKNVIESDDCEKLLIDVDWVFCRVILIKYFFIKVSIACGYEVSHENVKYADKWYFFLVRRLYRNVSLTEIWYLTHMLVLSYPLDYFSSSHCSLGHTVKSLNFFSFFLN